jgi:hypothetical protein
MGIGLRVPGLLPGEARVALIAPLGHRVESPTTLAVELGAGLVAGGFHKGAELADGHFGFRHQEWLGDLDGVLGMFVDDLIDVRLIFSEIVEYLLGRNVRAHQEPAGRYLYPLGGCRSDGLRGLLGNPHGAGRF